MGILFGGTQARGEETWTLSYGSFPEELNTQMPSPPPHIDNTQHHVQGETFEDISTEELMTSARRNRPCPSRNALFIEYENEDISLEAIDSDDSGTSDTDVVVDIAEQMEMSKVRNAIVDALFHS
ncbi:hypothetical protein MRB53_035210 [Persea americana]|uniref:Uncharacterized protein n=1 Tax=Persea americana TaxID=3435 RepID=A0ACC2K4J3_PERAE|nr:hypothetical protein MRB53_035210 [Persea americana]